MTDNHYTKHRPESINVQRRAAPTRPITAATPYAPTEVRPAALLAPLLVPVEEADEPLPEELGFEEPELAEPEGAAEEDPAAVVGAGPL